MSACTCKRKNKQATEETRKERRQDRRETRSKQVKRERAENGGEKNNKRRTEPAPDLKRPLVESISAAARHASPDAKGKRGTSEGTGDRKK